jgi:hypothetical protein
VVCGSHSRTSGGIKRLVAIARHPYQSSGTRRAKRPQRDSKQSRFCTRAAPWPTIIRSTNISTDFSQLDATHTCINNFDEGPGSIVHAPTACGRTPAGCPAPARGTAADN